MIRAFCLTAGALMLISGMAETGKTVALTFDDLPQATNAITLASMSDVTDSILQALDRHHAPAVGFVNAIKLHGSGQDARRISILERWLEHGHILGNQTLRYFRHPYNNAGPSPEMEQELTTFLRGRGYTIAPFTIEHGDYVYENALQIAHERGDDLLVKQIADAYLDALTPAFDYFEQRAEAVVKRRISQVLLLHANHINAENLDVMLARLDTRGYRFISLDDALRDPAYQQPVGHVGPLGISWIHRWAVARGLPNTYANDPDPPRFVIDLARQAR